MRKKWYAVCCVAAGLIFAGLLVLLLLGEKPFALVYTTRSLWKNWQLLPLSLAGAGGLWWLAFRENGSRKKLNLFWMAAYFAGLLALQTVILHSVWFYSGLDAQIVYHTAEELAQGVRPLEWTWYFEAFPNNAFVTAGYALLLKLGYAAGLAVPYILLVYLNGLALNLAALFAFLCVEELTQSRTARWCALALCTLWVGLSPHIMYVYTDALASPFPVMALYCLLKVRKPWLKWGLFTLVSFTGFAVKPTAVILWIAGVMVHAGGWMLGGWKNCGWKRSVLIVCAVLIGMLPGMAMQKISLRWITGSTSTEKSVVPTHYLMMGMRSGAYGSYSEEDTQFTIGIESKEERSRLTLEEAIRRIKSRTVAENADLLIGKAYKAYADGTFGSNIGLPTAEVPRKRDAMSLFFRSIFHTQGEYNRIHNTIGQGVWLGLLCLSAAGFLRRRKEAEMAVIGLAHCGLLLYQLLGETAPRYLFLYAPLFAVTAAAALVKRSPCKKQPDRVQ